MLWGRRVILQFGTAGDPGRSIEGLRVSFRVVMTDGSEPNKASVQAYNLSRASAALLERDDCVVRLLAGYDAPRQIFQGQIAKGGLQIERNGVDRIARIEAQDGGRSLAWAHIALSIAGPTTTEAVWTAIVAELGLAVGSVEWGAPVRYTAGWAHVGSAKRAIDALAASAGSRWYIRDGVLTVVPLTGATAETALGLSVANGNLIGAPVPTDVGVKVTSLLDASARPGRRFVVQGSERADGRYIATDVEHIGDSGWSREFYTTLMGRRE